jgi:hypothetical protein
MANKQDSPNQPDVPATEGESLADFQRRKNDAAWQSAGGQEDPGAAYQKAESKTGRQNVVPLTPESMEQIRNMARESGRPIHPESGLIWEPPVEKSVVGHSEEKKQAIHLMKNEGISIDEAFKRVQDGDVEPRKSRRKGK